ncbi:MAB_1171c family putative transporter [Streptomyces albidoflavus]|uniref:MAB_1171c family putative transporter n=1 Tax=Streptomyces albidoflavus TaxID=1886 RepID=UPI0033D9A4B9
MTPPDLYAWIVVAILTTEVLRRTPAALRNQRSRTLWTVFLALDLSMVTRISSVTDALHDLTGIADASTLTKHLVGIAAVAGLLRWVSAVVPGRMDGAPEPGYRRAISNRPRRIATWGAVIVITAIFPLAYRRPGSVEDADFIYQQAGHFWGSLHLLLFYAYLIFGMVCASLMCAAAARHPRAQGAFRHGMQAITVGCAIGAVYGVLRSGYLIARLFDKPFLGGDALVEIGSNLSLLACVFLVIGGAAAPAWERMGARIAAHAALMDLRPMWARLTDAVPVVLLDDAPAPNNGRPSGVRQKTRSAWTFLRDFWSWRDLASRLGYRVTQICDASLTIQQHITPELRDDVQQTATELGLPDHVATAYLLRTGIQHMKTGRPPYDGIPETPLLQPGADLLSATGYLLPIGKAMTDHVAMARLDRRLAVA